MKKRIQRYLRKRRHVRFVDGFLADARWDIINVVIAASATEYNDSVQRHLNNLGALVRKYERRKRWLKF